LEELKEVSLLNRRIGNDEKKGLDGGNKLFGGISCRLELV